MNESRWRAMPGHPPREGVVVELGPHLQHALIAYLAGPNHVQRVPRTFEEVRVCCGDGVRRRPATDEEKAEAQESLVDFLAEYGIPAPPSADAWRLHLPIGLTEEDLWDAVNGPDVRTHTADNAASVGEDLRVQLHRLLGPLD